MINFRLLWTIVKRCHLQTFMIGFLVLFFISAAIIQQTESGITSYGDALWYTFVACTTIGFGDFTAITHTGRFLTVFMTIYEILLVAMISGVVVTHYIEVTNRQQEQTATLFLEKAKHLTELTIEELDEIEEKVHKITGHKKN